jgi:hypothetical protein
MDVSRLRQGLPKTTTYILCSHLLFSVNSVHIVAWCEIKNVCWLSENDVIVRKLTDKIKWLAVQGNYEIIVDTTNSEDESLAPVNRRTDNTIFKRKKTNNDL